MISLPSSCASSSTALPRHAAASSVMALTSSAPSSSSTILTASLCDSFSMWRLRSAAAPGGIRLSSYVRASRPAAPSTGPRTPPAKGGCPGFLGPSRWPSSVRRCGEARVSMRFPGPPSPCAARRVARRRHQPLTRRGTSTRGPSVGPRSGGVSMVLSTPRLLKSSHADAGPPRGLAP